MKIYIEKDGKQEKIEAAAVKIGSTNLEQMFARIVRLEKELSKLIEERKEEAEQTKAFFLKRL
jgi:uncharacterized protein (UPF0335 family)